MLQMGHQIILALGAVKRENRVLTILVRRQKSIALGIRALGIEELPKRVSAEESRTPIRKQV